MFKSLRVEGFENLGLSFYLDACPDGYNSFIENELEIKIFDYKYKKNTLIKIDAL